MSYEYLEINGVKVPLPLSAFPIGSIYMSINDTDPASFLGGTWERIKDRFLLSAGDTYEAGSIGGSANSELIAHNHEGLHVDGVSIGWGKALNESAISGTLVASAIAAEGADATRVNTEQSGTTDGNGKNMPPYLAVYMWKRVA